MLLTVTKQPNTGTIELTERLDAAIADLQKNLPADVHVSTDIFRQSTFIENSINNVKRSLYEGAVFVVIVLFVFLANFRTTIISLITLPLSLLITILVLDALGLSINTMSLGGMAIAIGSLVDDAIVDVENVWKHLRENRALPPGKRLATVDVVFNASKEVRMPILNSTLIIIVSFVPLFFLNGMEGRMLIPLGVSFIVALFASTIVALTLTPVLCSYLLAGKKHSTKVPKEAFVASWLQEALPLQPRLGHEPQNSCTKRHYHPVRSCLGFFFTLWPQLPPSFNEGSFTINVSSCQESLLKNRPDRQAGEELLAHHP